MTGEAARDLVVCTSAAGERIREHVTGELEREVGGFLAGHLVDGRAHVQVAIPALRAESNRTNVTFTHDVWDDTLELLAKEHPDLQIVGWYHSHPGFGIFLSEYDQFIHRNFFSAEGMAALVVDPHTGAEGWFISEGGDVVRADGDEPVATPRDRPSAPPAPATTATSGGGTSSRGMLVLVGAAALLTGFVGGWLIGDAGDLPDSMPEELATALQRQEEVEADLAEVHREREELAADLEVALQRAEEAELLAGEATAVGEGSPAEPTEDPDTPDDAPPDSEEAEQMLTYRVRPGDTLWNLASSLAPDPEEYLARIIDANPDLQDPDVITVGTELQLPLP